jgi:hypothetical protein
VGEAGEGPLGVGEGDGGRGECPHEAQVGARVAREDRAGAGGGARIGAGELGIPLASGDEERAEAGRQDEPVRQRDAGRETAREGAEEEAARDDEELNDRLALEPQGVGHREHEVDGDNQQEPTVRQRGDADGGDREEDGCGAGQREGQVTGGDGPTALCRVRPIEVDVDEVVDEVDGGAGQDQRHRRHDGDAEDVWGLEGSAGKGSGEDEDVLDPLAWPAGTHERTQRADGGVRGWLGGHGTTMLAA